MWRESEIATRMSNFLPGFLRRIGLGVAVFSALSVSALLSPDRAWASGEKGVLLELFTSQGCYSCPPADKLLGRLASQKGVIGLSLNVDYWDYLGWKDPLAQKAYTLRQYGYVNAMRERAPFTPQLVVHGDHSVVGSDARKVANAVKAAQNDDSIDLALSRDGETLRVAIAKAGAADGCVVLAAPYRKAVRQEIPRGENGGKTLTYHNVALEVRQLGRFSGGEATFSAAIPDGADGVAVWVQRTTDQGPFGAVQTAAKLEF